MSTITELPDLDPNEITFSDIINHVNIIKQHIISNTDRNNDVQNVNQTSNNVYTVDVSVNTTFMLQDSPTGNFTVNVYNVGSLDNNTTRTFQVCYKNNSMKYCNNINIYSDNGQTPITMTSSYPIFLNGSVVNSNSTVLIQTFKLIKFDLNYCLSHVNNYF